MSSSDVPEHHGHAQGRYPPIGPNGAAMQLAGDDVDIQRSFVETGEATGGLQSTTISGPGGKPAVSLTPHGLEFNSSPGHSREARTAAAVRQGSTGAQDYSIDEILGDIHDEDEQDQAAPPQAVPTPQTHAGYAPFAVKPGTHTTSHE